MRKAIFLIAVICLCTLLFSACDTTVKVADGTYRVEMAEFDENGYKDYVEFVIVGGKVISIDADAYHIDDEHLKTESSEMRLAMESITGTYPEKFYNDLVNEYIGSGGENTDVIAGATLSSNNFFKLMEVAKKAAKTGDTSIKVVYSSDN